MELLVCQVCTLTSGSSIPLTFTMPDVGISRQFEHSSGQFLAVFCCCVGHSAMHTTAALCFAAFGIMFSTLVHRLRFLMPWML